MKQLYCPWRSAYSEDDSRSKQSDATQDECVFCQQFNQTNDDNNLIIKRFEHNIVMLNKFPYNAGHILILPKNHVSDLDNMSSEARNEMMELIHQGTNILRKAVHAQGVNIGMNVGKIAGGGIPSHLHMHIVPRYAGDTNFLTTIGQTKNISFDLQEILKKLKKHF
jgi:ATP adenylyltransferase